MLTFRARLRPRSATLSPWQADTLFGHLCWLIRYDDGEAALYAFLDEYLQGQPPMLFSNGFPGDWLPRPLGPAPAVEQGTKSAQVRAMQAAKADKNVRWLHLDEFNAYRRGQGQPLDARPKLLHERTELKNQINRLTGGTTPLEEREGAGGNLYAVNEITFADRSGLSPVGLDVSIYVRARDEEQAERARELLQRLARSGYGAKKSAGYGHFTLAAWKPFTGLAAPPPDANGFISLSNWTPAPGDPTRGFYATLVKYGKLGEGLAAAESSFKFPLIMFRAGSSFYSDAPPRNWYGRLVENIAPAAPSVVQYAFAFAVPARLNEER